MALIPPDFDPSDWVFNDELRVTARRSGWLWCYAFSLTKGLEHVRFSLPVKRKMSGARITAKTAKAVRWETIEGRIEWLRRTQDGAREPMLILDPRSLATYLREDPAMRNIDGCPPHLRADLFTTTV